MAKPRARVLSYESLCLLSKQLTAEILMTPCHEFVTVTPQTTVAEARRLMKRHEFDQLPVKDGDKTVGLLREKQISCPSLQEQEGVDAYIDRQPLALEVPVKCQIGDLLDKMRNQPCILVRDNNDIVGLIHYSDMNRQGVRIYFYLWLAAAEMALAEIIRSKYPNEDCWIELLGDQKQVQILDRREIDKRNNLHIFATAYADFSSLINVVSKDKDKKIWSELGYQSQREWERATGKLVELRNNVMHPVGALVRKPQEVGCLGKCSRDLKKLVERLLDALERGQAYQSEPGGNPNGF